ncbi:hypothetical protein POM88_032503 [Heracleum sosnowskyi]|uniref:AT-hook motif nuclear-localized protein n=1 Tax=Heracleum sosnowskyi TaxID=360622 RepID=A0AAD8I098_9APIA|nr:hypothetical protein POM88_032503 [Heracleum sosnowskyi]
MYVPSVNNKYYSVTPVKAHDQQSSVTENPVNWCGLKDVAEQFCVTSTNSVPSPFKMDAPLSPAVYTGSSVPEINVSSLEPLAMDSPPAKLSICLDDGNDDLLDELLTPCELFTPSVVTVEAGEDVRSKIIEFYDQQAPGHAVCIMSAIGKLSEITLNNFQLSSDASVTYKGQFTILSLQGSFIPSSLEGSDHTGTLSITFAAGDEKVAGGEVAGPLNAATSVLVTVGSFFPSLENVMEQ